MAAPTLTNPLNPVTLLAAQADGTVTPVLVSSDGVIASTNAIADAVLGVSTGAAVITDANGTIQQYLRGLVKRWVDALGAGTAAAALRVTTATDDTMLTSIRSPGLSASVTVTRPSNTNTYGVLDVLGPTGGGTASMNFALGAVSGSNIRINSISLMRNVAALISGETTYILHLYNVTQPSAQADEATFDLAAGDRTAYLGNIAISTPVDLVSTLYIKMTNLNFQCKLAGTGIFGVLVTVGTYAAASASVLVVTVDAEQF